VIVYCKSGRRAAKAVEVLKGHGYTHVYNAGGIADLEELTKNIEHIVVEPGEHSEQ
jgi:phage shock protein E